MKDFLQHIAYGWTLLSFVFSTQVWADTASLEMQTPTTLEQTFTLPYDISGFRESPITADQSTEVRIRTEDNVIHIKFLCKDSDPSSLRLKQSFRDQIGDEDFVDVIFNPDRKGRKGYAFSYSVSGTKGDYLYDQVHNSYESEWNPSWNAEAKRTEDGYEIDMHIPLKIFTYSPLEKDLEWAIVLRRIRPRDQSQVYSNTQSRLEGMCPLCTESRLHIPVKNEFQAPATTLTYIEKKFSDSNKRNSKPFGGDIKWKPLSNLTTSATINPDYSDISLDKISLSMNKNAEIYKLEKRDFFTENNAFFFTPTNNLYSRTISQPSYGASTILDLESSELGLLFAEDTQLNTVVYDKAGRYSTLIANHQLNRNLVARYKLDQSGFNLGLNFLARSSRDIENSVYGFDITKNVWKDVKLLIETYASATENRGLRDEDDLEPSALIPRDKSQGDMLHVRLESAKPSWWTVLDYQKSTRDYLSLLGYPDSPNTQKLFAQTGPKFYFENPWLSSLELMATYVQTDYLESSDIASYASPSFSIQGGLDSYLNLTKGKTRESYASKVYTDLKDENGYFTFAPTTTTRVSVFHGQSEAVNYDYAERQAVRNSSYSIRQDLFTSLSLKARIEELKVKSASTHYHGRTQSVNLGWKWSSFFDFSAIAQRVHSEQDSDRDKNVQIQLIGKFATADDSWTVTTGYSSVRTRYRSSNPEDSANSDAYQYFGKLTHKI